MSLLHVRPHRAALAALLVFLTAPACGSDSDSGSANRAECKKFGFVVSGEPCGSGCTTVGCSCDGSPRSVGGCTQDGCVVEVDCDGVCGAASVEAAVDCTDTYSIQK